MSNGKILVPPGFSPKFAQRMENQLLQKAAQVPGLPPQIAMQVNQGIHNAFMNNQFSQIQLALGNIGNVKNIRILIYRDEMSEQKKVEVPELPQQEEPKKDELQP